MDRVIFCPKSVPCMSNEQYDRIEFMVLRAHASATVEANKIHLADANLDFLKLKFHSAAVNANNSYFTGANYDFLKLKFHSAVGNVIRIRITRSLVFW